MIKSIINKRKYCPVNLKFKYNGDVISDGKTVANKFNTFFVNVGESLANEIHSIDRYPSEYIKVEISDNFFVSAVTEDEIGKIICNFHGSAVGWYDLRPRIIKLIQSGIKKTTFGPYMQSLLYDRHIPKWVKNCKCCSNIQIWWWYGIFQLQACFCVTCIVKNIRKTYVWLTYSVHQSPWFIIWISVWISKGKIHSYGSNNINW